MRFALLGIDPDARRLVRAVCALEAHQLVAVCTVPEDQPLRELAPQAKWHAEWEELLSDDFVDAVIVARSPVIGQHDDPLRKLAQKAVPLLLVHPAAEPLLCYELEMIQRDTNGVLFPYIPERGHPAMERLAQWSRDADRSPIGALQQIVVERALHDSARQAVVCQFANDVELIAGVAGTVQRVNAIGPPADSGDFANLSVQMSCADGRVARWSFDSPTDDARSSLTVIGSQGKATLVISATKAWHLQTNSGSNETFGQHDDAAAALAAFCRAVGGQAYRPDWPQACRSVEIADAIPRSLRRGRTVDILDEQHSEEQSFKGIMAAGGCAVLLAVLVVMLVLALVDGLAMPHRQPNTQPITAGESSRLPFETDPRDPEQAHVLLRIWPVYPIAVFLLLQFFRLIIRKERAGKTTAGDAVPPAQAT